MPVPTTPTASNNGPLCAGATLNLSTPLVASATYAWTGPNSFSSTLQNPTIANVTAAAAGTYNVTVTVAGCTSVAGTTTVVINPVPATPTASNNGPLCAGTTLNLSTPLVAGATYAWTGPNSFSSTLQNPTIANVTTAASGTYNVTITVAGCTSVAGTTSVVVNALPATPTASNNGPLCAGATLNLSTPLVAGATYAWTGPNSFSSTLQNPTIATVTAADAGTYNVTVTVAGCTSVAGTTTVVINPVPATPTASNNGPLCAGATLNLSTPLVASATYAWTGPNSFSSTLQNPTIANVTAAAAGTYNVTVTVAGCTSVAGTTTVVINPVPATPTASNNGPLCAGTTLNLSTPLVAGATYAWTGPNSFSSTLQNPTIANVTTAASGTYNVTVTVAGCTSMAGTTTVVVNVLPATPTASNNGPLCAGATLNLSTPLVAGATYAWTGPNSFSSTLQNPTIANVTAAAAGTYNVTVTVAGCTSVAGTTTVVINPVPATPTASNNGPLCAGTTLNLSTPLVAGATYAWTGPNSFSSTLQNPTIANVTTAASGTYNVTITVAGCTSVAGTTSVVVNALPATPTASNNGPLCAGATLNLSTPLVAGATYAWTGPNSFSSTLQNPTIATVTAADAGTYNVTVTVAGCTSVAGTTTVVINPVPATPTASNNGPLCAGATLNLSTPLVASATYAWTGPNSFSSTLQNPTIANVTAAAAGTYNVTVTVAGCTSVAGTTTVVVNAIPAQPTISAGGPLTFCDGGSVTLTASAGASYLWSNGATTQIINVTTSGNYSVQVTNPAGCQSPLSTPTSVTVNPAPAIPVESTDCSLGAGNAAVTVTTPTGVGLEYSLDGGPYQSGVTFNSVANGSHTISVRNTSGCTTLGNSFSVSCGCVNGPTLTLADNTGNTCGTIPVTISGNTFTNATSVTITGNGAGSLTPASAGTSPFAFTYTPAAADAGNTVTITVTTDNPSGAPCAAAIETYTLTVDPLPSTPTISANGLVTFCSGGSVTLTSSAGTGYLWSTGATTPSIVVNTGGNYSVQVTNAAGCQSLVSATTVVTVDPLPATPTITAGGPLTFCDGGSVTLTSSAGSSYLWSNGAITQSIDVTASSNYTVQVTNAAGCQSVASAATIVTVNPVPAVPVETTDCSLGAGNASVTVTSPTGAGLEYSLDGLPFQPGVTFTGIANGSHTITVRNASGCETTGTSFSVSCGCVNGPELALSSTSGSTCGVTPVTISGNIFSNATSVTITEDGAGSVAPVASATSPFAFTYTPAAGDAGNTVTITVTTDNPSGAPCAAAVETYTLTVNALPAQPTISAGGPVTFCEGGSVTLTSSPGSSFLWSTGATTQSIDVTTAGSYTVQVTNATGCQSVASAATIVTVNAVPAASVQTTDCSLGSGNASVTVTSPTGAGLEYSLDGLPFQPGVTFTGIANGSHTITVRNAAGCDNYRSKLFCVMRLRERTGTCSEQHEWEVPAD